MAIVKDELDRMGRIVDDLLMLAKAERPDFLALEDLDLDVLTEELMAKARALGAARLAAGERRRRADDRRPPAAHPGHHEPRRTTPSSTPAEGDAIMLG